MRDLAEGLGVRPTKTLGQNFVHDANTVRRIVKVAELTPDDVVCEVGPGLGSLTLGLLGAAAHVVAIEIDPRLAAQLPTTVQLRAPHHLDRLTVVTADALTVASVSPAPTALVANLPYNVAVPVVLHLLEVLPTLTKGLVMVQSEVADRLTASPGNKVYGIPTVKAAWWVKTRRAGSVPRNVFWPVPNVDSALVGFLRQDPPETTANRREVFAVIDAAFAQRRKALRGALTGWAGSPVLAEEVLRRADIDPLARGETLTVAQFARIAEARRDRSA